MYKIVMAAFVVLTAILVACGSLPTSGGGNKTSEVIAYISDDTTTLVTFDVSALRADPDMEDVYETYEDYFVQQTDFIGEDVFEDTDLLSRVISDSGYLLYVQGTLDTSGIEDELEDMGYEDDEYREVQIWQGSGMWSNIAFLGEDKALLGQQESTVKDAVRASKGEQETLSSNEHASDVIKKLPQGFVTMVSLECDSDLDLSGCESMGITVTKEDASTLNVTAVLKFSDDRRAERALEDFEDSLGDDEDYFGIEVKQSGQYLEAKAKIDLGDYADSPMIF